MTSGPPQSDERAPFAVSGTALVTGALAVLLLAVAGRYGPHRDELYFASAGHRLAWGYPDQPSLVALFTRVSQDVGGHSLVLLRLPSIVAVCGTVVMTTAIARVLGGDRRGQLLTAVLVATSAVVVILGHRLTTQTLSLAAWTGLALVAAHALSDDRPRLWLVAGLVAGVGLNAKHDLVVALLGLVVGVALTPAVRHHLRSPWWWAGGGVALLLWLPNLLWQARHGWPVFTLSAEIRDEYGGVGGALAYVALTLVVFSPLMTVVWGAGLVGLLRRAEWARLRPLGWVFVVTFLFFLVTGGKAYYLAGAVPPLLAAGAVLAARRRQRLVRFAVVLALSAAVAWPAGLPLLPARTYASSFYPALDDSGLESIGWPQLTHAVRRALAPLPRGAIVFTGNYGEAGALEWYGVRAKVYSGHNGWGDWGPPPDSALPVVVLGYEDGSPSVDFRGCHVVGHEPTVDGADNEEHGLKIYVCAGPRTTWSQEWPRLVHLDA